MSEGIIHQLTEIYRTTYIKHGNTPRGVFINNSDTQHLRFERILRNLTISKKISLLDIGSGICALHEYLNSKKIAHTYYGSEIVKEMIDYSKKKFPEATIYSGHILKNKKIPKCDWVVSSGMFNIKASTSTKNWNQYVFANIKKMFALSKNGIVFNLLTTYNDFESPELSYFDPKYVLDFCINNLSRFVTIDHSYPLYEFTITVYQNNYMKSCYKDNIYSKYFKHLL